jgi:hypothetical protein
MPAYAYRLPRKYRYRARSRSAGRDRAIAVAAAAVLVLAAGGAKAAAHHAASGAHGSAPGAVLVTAGSRTAFIRAVLADMGAPATRADIASLAAWFPHEGTAAANNPMASTMREPGSTTFNYDGVQNYATATQGAAATAATLLDGRYPLIVAALRSGAGLCGNPSLAGEFLVWSGNGYPGVC